MSLKRKILNFFTAIVMVFGNVPFTFSNAYAAEPAGEAPRSSKTVKANGDGTYDITLEIEGVSSQKTDVTKANVVVVYDTSGSMKYPEPSTEFGRYGYSISNGYEIDTDNYVDLYYQSGTDWYGRPTYELVGDNDNHSTVYTRSWSYWENDWVYSVYDNPRYSNKNATQTRASVAETALNSLAEQLLANNDPSNEKPKTLSKWHLSISRHK